MKVPQQESQAAALPVAVSSRRNDKTRRLSTLVRAQSEGEPIWTPEFRVAPPIAVLQLVTGRWVAQIVGVAAELGLADEIQGGPKTAQEIATAKGLQAPALYRLLRALASVGIFAEQEDGRFRQTPMSDTLRSDVPYSMRGVACMSNLRSVVRGWMELERSVRTNTSAFEHEHGTPIFHYLNQHPEDMEVFADAMDGYHVLVAAAVVEAYNFSYIRTLAEIGGSLALAGTLVKHPTMRGILFDLPPVVESASSFLRNQGVLDRVEIKGGNFFEAVPAGADAYLLQNILHWRSDEDCARILKAVHANARSGAKLLLVEAIVEASNEPQFAKTLDIAMLVLSDGGKERTQAEWQELLNACGFRLSRIVPTASFASVIEAIRD
ncbi:MAG TPA: methyltransferase [Chthoniobacterales bacterium]|nr:methyltransferase [Chthoniobacterales bacterium]